MSKEPKPDDVPRHEEMDSPTYADDRNFYKVGKWSRGWDRGNVVRRALRTASLTSS
jgi:hypothetical protein